MAWCNEGLHVECNIYLSDCILCVLLQALDSQPMVETEPMAADSNTAEAPQVDWVWEAYIDSIHVIHVLLPVSMNFRKHVFGF